MQRVHSHDGSRYNRLRANGSAGIGYDSFEFLDSTGKPSWRLYRADLEKTFKSTMMNRSPGERPALELYASSCRARWLLYHGWMS